MEHEHDRRPVFNSVLADFCNKPINILEVGSIRIEKEVDLDGDGGFSIYACDYVIKNGGSFTSFDLDSNAIDRARVILNDFVGKIDLRLIHDNAEKYLEAYKDFYDLIYLDGSSSNLEALRQLELALKTKAFILCDDFGDKFVLASKVHTGFRLIQVNSVHQMALYYPKLVTSKNTLEIDANQHPALVDEQFFRIDRTKFNIVIINAHLGTEKVREYVRDYQVLSPTVIFYGRKDSI